MKKTPAFKQIFMPNFEGPNRRRLIGAGNATNGDRRRAVMIEK
jgi:hypothetical protein